MEHDEINADTWKHKRDEWMDYVENDVLCTASSYARYIQSMEELLDLLRKVVYLYKD